MRTFLNRLVRRRHADIAVYPTAQTRIGAEGRQLARVHQNHQPFSLTLRGGLRIGKRLIDFRLQSIRFGLLAENPAVSINARLRALLHIVRLRRHIDGRRKLGQFVGHLIFSHTAADNDQLRVIGVQGFVIRLEQRARLHRVFQRRIQIGQILRIHRRADFHAQFAQRIDRAQIINRHTFGILRHNGFAVRGLDFNRAGRHFGCGGTGLHRSGAVLTAAGGQSKCAR